MAKIKRYGSAKVDPKLLEQLKERQKHTGQTVVWMLNEAIKRFLLPSERLRVCKRPDCTHPFVARHLKQNYCSDECARWGQKKWKKQWWDEHGEEWRKNRKRETGKEKTKTHRAAESTPAAHGTNGSVDAQ